VTNNLVEELGRRGEKELRKLALSPLLLFAISLFSVRISCLKRRVILSLMGSKKFTEIGCISSFLPNRFLIDLFHTF
jgi:hypothetical protein